jgi:hypothetical protein
VIVFATPILVLLAWLLGRGLAERFAPAARGSFSVCLAAGLVALHVILQALALAGWRWDALWLVAAALVAAAVLLRHWRGRWQGGDALSRLGWGDGLAAVLWLFTTWAAVVPQIDNADFFYHWGVKGRKFALAAGIDWRFLTSAPSWLFHPDYPNLLPELTSWTIRLAGSAAEGPQLLWSAVFFAALLLAARDATAALGMSRRTRQIALASTAAGVAAIAFSVELAGTADWLIAWAMVLALPALARPAAPGAEFRLGAAAALAAAAKIEGMPVSVMLVALFVLHRGLEARAFPGLSVPQRTALAAAARAGVSAARAGVPVAAVIFPWWVFCRRYSLIEGMYHGRWSWARLGTAAPGLIQGLFSPAWGGLALTLLLLPWLVARPRTRWPALMACAQVAFYVYIYASAPVDTAFFVRFSWTRILAHVLPAIWLLAFAALAEPEAAPGLRPRVPGLG